MAENIGKVTISDVAKQLAGMTKDSMEAIRLAQNQVAFKLELARKAEALFARAQATAAEPETTPLPEATEIEIEKTQETSPAKGHSAEKEPESTPAQEAPVVEPVVDPVETKQEPEQLKKPQAPLQTQEPKPIASETPQAPRRAPRTELLNRPIRDDAAVRNATRVGVPQGQRNAAGTSGAGRPPRQEGRPFNRENRPPRTSQGDGSPRYNNAQNPRQNGQRSAGSGVSRNSIVSALPLGTSEKGKVSNYDPNRQNYIRVFDNDKKGKSKKALDKERRAQQMGIDDDFVRSRKRRKPTASQPRPEPIVITHAVITTEMVMVKTLAEKIGKPAAEILKRLLSIGVMTTINNEIDFDTASLIASDFGVELEQKLDKTAEEVMISIDSDEDSPELLEKRPPVVTIMGHVDHGKTSLLDAIRKSRITAGEAGGITQHIGAYTVSIHGESITFLDTPGHEAFTAMRARGAQVTDAVILVVAADDGIMPQTIEAINHSKSAGVPIIVAINKIDRPNANPERVKQELTEHGLVWEEWGGDTIIVPVSAITHEGLDNLLEMVLLVAEMAELKANPNRLARGTIIEARLDKGRGPVATVLVQNGTLKVGDTIVTGTCSGRVRAMTDDKGNKVTNALPSQPVEVLGLDDVPEAGDALYAVDDKLSRQVVEERRNRIKNDQLKNMSKVSLDDLFNQISRGDVKDLNIIVKADVQGSVEAIKASLEKLSNEEVRVHCIHGGVGGITQADVMLASASGAIIIGFNVRPDATARNLAATESVDIRLYRVIYDAIEDVEKAIKGLLAPVFREVIVGRAEVRETFKVSSVGTIAGCYVQEGKLTRNVGVRLIRDSVVIYEGKLDSLKRFKDDVREVLTGYECGLSLNNFNDIKQGDIIEAFESQEVEQ